MKLDDVTKDAEALRDLEGLARRVGTVTITAHEHGGVIIRVADLYTSGADTLRDAVTAAKGKPL